MNKAPLDFNHRTVCVVCIPPGMNKEKKNPFPDYKTQLHDYMY